MLIRATAGALVAYFVYSFVAPPLLMLLEMKQSWFADVRAWIDPSVTQDALFGSTSLTGEQWQQLVVTTGRLAGGPADDRRPAVAPGGSEVARTGHRTRRTRVTAAALATAQTPATAYRVT